MQADFLSDRSLALRYSLSYAAIFFVMGVLGPFFSLFLNGQGFEAATIGFLLALGGPVRIVAGPLMGWMADSGVAVRWLAGPAQIVAALCMVLMMGAASIPVMALLVAVLYAAHGPLSAMIDASVSHSMSKRGALSYPRIRLWGSLAFIAGNLCGGFVADRSSVGIAVLAAIGLCAGAGLSWFLPQDRRNQRSAVAADDRQIPARWGMIALIVLATACIQASHSAIYTIGALAWRAQGLPQTMTGVFWILGVLVEVILFLRIGQVVSGRRRAILFVALGGVLAVLRWIVMASTPGLALTILCQLLHGLTFGATHLGSIAALAVLSPPGYRSRIQGVSAAVHALASSTAVYLSGALYQNGGAPAAYGLMAAYAAFGLAVVTMLYWMERRQVHQPYD